MQNGFSDKGSMYLNLYMLKKVVWASKKAIGLGTDYSKIISRAKTYDKLRMFKKAIHSYEQAVFINPSNAEAYYSLGNTYSNAGMYKEAVNAYKRAIGNKSKYTEALYRLSIAYGKLDRIKDAIDITKRVIRIMPNMAAAHKNLGIFYGTSGSYREAIAPLNKALEIDHDNADARSRLIQYYLKLNDKTSAKREHKILQDISPHMAQELSHEIPK